MLCSVCRGNLHDNGGWRGLGAVEEEDEERWMSRIRTVVREENKVLVGTFEKHFTVIESPQDQLEGRIEQLERKHGRAPGSSHQNTENFSTSLSKSREVAHGTSACKTSHALRC